MKSDLETLGLLQELEKELANFQKPAPKPPEDPERQKEIASCHIEQGGMMAAAGAQHLNVGQEGYAVLQAKIHLITRQVKDGDLSAIEQALVEQFFLLHNMAAAYGIEASNMTGSRMKHAPAFVEMTVKCSKASRQLAQTIADLKAPRKTQFIKQNIEAQQNNLYALDSSNAKEMDGGTEAAATGEDTVLEAVAVEHRPQVGLGKKAGSQERG